MSAEAVAIIGAAVGRVHSPGVGDEADPEADVRVLTVRVDALTAALGTISTALSDGC